MTERLRTNTLQLTFASVGQKALAFFYFLILARFIGAESTGEYFLALSITTIFSVVTDLGLQPVLIREVAKDREQWPDLARNAFTLKIVFTLLSAVLVVLFVSLMGYTAEVKTLVYVAIAVMALDAVSLTMYGLLRGLQILLYESIGMFVGQLLTALVGVSALVLHLPLPFLIVALVVGSFWNALFSLLMVARRLPQGTLRFRWSGAVVKKLLRLALPFALAGIFVKVYSYVDTLTLSKFFGETEVGVYAVAYKFTYAFQFLPMAFVAALYPALSSLLERGREELSRVFEQSMLYMMVLATPIVFGIWSLAGPLVAVSVGEEFSASAPVLATLIFVLLFLFLDFPIGSLLNAADRQVLKTTLMGVTMVLNVVANFLLVPRLGAMGAAIAANISFAFLFFSGLYFVPQFVTFHWRTFWSRIIRMLLAGLFMGLLVRSLSGIIPLALAVLLGAVSYPLLLLGLRLFRVHEVKTWYAKLAPHA